MPKLVIFFENISSRILSIFLKPLFLILESSKIGRMALFKSKRPNTIFVSEASNIKFLINSSDMGVGFPTYINKRAYDSEKVVLIFDFLQRQELGVKRSILLDIGANIGTIGLTALAHGVVSEVWAFEPEPHNYSILVSNISLNGLTESVRHFNVALTDSGDDSDLEFELDCVNFGDHRVRRTNKIGLYREESRQVIKVKSAMLDSFCDELDFDNAIVWLDTQGYEGYVLSGSAMLIKNKVPIVTEFWPYGLKRSGCFDKFVDSILSGPYNSIVDLKNFKATLNCDRSTLIALSNIYGFDGVGTDLLIY